MSCLLRFTLENLNRNLKRSFYKVLVDDILYNFLYMSVCSGLVLKKEFKKKKQIRIRFDSVEGEASRNDERYLWV